MVLVEGFVTWWGEFHVMERLEKFLEQCFVVDLEQASCLGYFRWQSYEHISVRLLVLEVLYEECAGFHEVLSTIQLGDLLWF